MAVCRFAGLSGRFCVKRGPSAAPRCYPVFGMCRGVCACVCAQASPFLQQTNLQCYSARGRLPWQPTLAGTSTHLVAARARSGEIVAMPWRRLGSTKQCTLAAKGSAAQAPPSSTLVPVPLARVGAEVSSRWSQSDPVEVRSRSRLRSFSKWTAAVFESCFWGGGRGAVLVV